jgi:hypothetical protein
VGGQRHARSGVLRDLTRGETGGWWVGGSTARPSLSYPFAAKFKPEPVTASLVNPDAPVKPDPDNKKLQLHTVKVINHTDTKVPRRRLRVSNLPLVVLVANGTNVPRLRAWDIVVPEIPAKGSVTVTLRYFIPTRPAIVFQPSLQLLEAR